MLASGGSGALEIMIEAHRLWLGGNLPFGRAKDDAHMGRVKLQQPRRNRVSFARLVDGGDNNMVAGNVNNDAGAGQARHDFVFALLGLHGSCDQQRCK